MRPKYALEFRKGPTQITGQLTLIRPYIEIELQNH